MNFVKCIDSDSPSLRLEDQLTKYKTYRVIDSVPGYTKITNDQGRTQYYKASRFIKIPEIGTFTVEFNVDGDQISANIQGLDSFPDHPFGFGDSKKSALQDLMKRINQELE